MTQAVHGYSRPAFPKVGEVFELTTSEEITGLGLVADFGYTPDRWRSTAVTVPAGTTRKFKLIAVGRQPDLDAVTLACKAQGGKSTNGCWMKVFDNTFGHSRRNSVGVADPSWVHPNGNARFPMVHRSGDRDFLYAGGFRFESWLWLVEVVEAAEL